MGRTGTKQLKAHEADQIVQQINVDGGVSGRLGDNYYLSPSVYTAIQMLLSLFPLKSEKGYHHTHAPLLMVLQPLG